MKASKIKTFGNAVSKFSQTTFVFFAFLTALPCNAQSLATLHDQGTMGDVEVVATAGLGGNEVKVITLTPRWGICTRSMEPNKCIDENQGTYKTTHMVNCAARSVHSQSGSWSDDIDVEPGHMSFATSPSYSVYDYACNTNYSDI